MRFLKCSLAIFTLVCYWGLGLNPGFGYEPPHSQENPDEITDSKTIATVPATCSEEIMQKWCDRMNKSLEKRIRDACEGINAGTIKSDGPVTMEPVEEIALDKAADYGIPKEVQVPLEDEGKVENFLLKELPRFEVGKYPIILARYENKDADAGGQEVDVYVKKEKGYVKSHGGAALFCGMYPESLGGKSPIFLYEWSGNGGSGWNGELSSLDSSGNLKSAVVVGGWQGELGFYDFDGNGMLEIFNAVRTVVPDDLDKLLKQCKDYAEQSPFFFYVMTVYKWGNGKFNEIGYYYFLNE